jgi:hypothetical protein
MQCIYTQSNILYRSGQPRMGGWHRLGSDDAFQIRQVLLPGLGFPPALAGLSFSQKKVCYSTYGIFTPILTFPAVIHSYFILGITCRPAMLFKIVMIFSRKMHMACISLGLIILKYVV